MLPCAVRAVRNKAEESQETRVKHTKKICHIQRIIDYDYLNLVYDPKSGAYAIFSFFNAHEMAVVRMGVARSLDDVVAKFFEAEMRKYESAIELYQYEAEDHILNEEEERREAKEKVEKLLREATKPTIYNIYEESTLKF